MKPLSFLTMLACLPVFGQINQNITCVPSAGNFPTIRHEGYNEQVSTVLTCIGASPTPAAQPVPLVDITVTSNVPVSNQPIIPGSSWVNAYLVIDDPAPANLNVAPVKASSGLSYNGPPIMGVGGSGLNYANGSVPNVFYGRQSGVNSITFAGIPFDLGSSGPSSNGLHTEAAGNAPAIKTRYYIERIAEHIADDSADPVDLTQLFFILFQALAGGKAHPAAAEPSAASIEVTPSTLDLGPILDCFHYQAIAGRAPAIQPFNAALLGTAPAVPASPSAALNFSNLFPGCLRTRSTGFQDVIGQTYYTDAGFTSPALPPALANFGTEFQAVFNNIPAGVSVFVQTTVTSKAGTIQLTSPGTAAGSTGLTQLPVINGSATAIWETQSTDPTQTDTFAVPVYFAFQAGVPAPANITVVQSLGSPPGGAGFAQPPASLLPPILFTINTGGAKTPTRTAVVDSRPCILGPIFRSGNACSPTNGLFVNIFSDSAPVAQNSPTFTEAGGLTNFALTGFSTTPTQSEIYPNASKAVPGVYTEMMNVTAAIGGDSLGVPFAVTVLPPNNPILELNGFTDAFSYQPESVAPGQIYTLFGTNFGPSSLVSGTLDSSGKLSTNVANTQVLFDGVLASPLLYVANGQLSGVAPFELTGKATTSVQVVANGLKSPAVTVPVQKASISIASADGSGGNGAVIINADGTLNTTSNPASVGDIVVFYASYAGPFANDITGTDGRTTTSAPYPAPDGPTSVMFGGVPATNIAYFGNAPGFLESVMQINVSIPVAVQPDLHVPVVISAGGATSAPWTTIAVK